MLLRLSYSIFRLPVQRATLVTTGTAPCLPMRFLSGYTVVRSLSSKPSVFQTPSFKMAKKKDTNAIENEIRIKHDGTFNVNPTEDLLKLENEPMLEEEKMVMNNRTFNIHPTEDLLGLENKPIPEKVKIIKNVRKVCPSEYILEDENKHTPDWSLKSSKQKKAKNHTKKINPKGENTMNHAQGFRPKGEMLFGGHPVLMALESKKRQFHSIFLKEMTSLEGRLKLIQQLAEERQIPIQFVDAPTLDHICERPVHQGVCADVSRLKKLEYTEGVNSWLPDEKHENPPLWLVLDNIHDPMNYGAILRCSHYFGVSKIFSTHANCCKLSPFVSKASAGVMEIMDIFGIADLQFFLKVHKDSGWQVIGSSTSNLHLSVQDLRDFQMDRPTILLLGNEGTGLEPELLAICDQLISIFPLKSLHPEVDSLNVSVATGIILYHLLSRRKLE